VAPLVDPRRTDTRKVFAARQRLQRIFGGRDEFAALQPRRGGQLLLQTRGFLTSSPAARAARENAETPEDPNEPSTNMR
jgi:hypothetical protein